MLEKVNLSLWDVGAYLIIGFFVSIITLTYCFIKNVIDPLVFFAEIRNYSAILVILMPICFLFLGMTIEPFANLAVKKIEKTSFFKAKESRNKDKLISIIEASLPDPKLKDVNIYKYCKAVLENKSPNSKHEIFLARFGFYRSLSFIFITISAANIIILEITVTSILSSFLFIAVAHQCLKRAQLFKVHLEESVYYNYIALNK